MRRSLSGLSPRTLRLALALFFLALALPTAVLVHQAYSQLKWEAFHQHRVMAEELSDRIRARIANLIAAEEARRFADYAFLNVAGDPAANYVQRSPLSGFPLASELPGVVGYFQVDTGGAFSTPVLPPAGTDASTVGISAAELQQRRQLAQRIQSILSLNRLVRAPDAEGAAKRWTSAASTAAATQRRDENRARAQSPAAPRSQPEVQEEAAGQAVFDQLSRAPTGGANAIRKTTPSTLGRVEDLKLEQRFAPQIEAEQLQSKAARQAPQQTDASAPRQMRKEISALPVPQPSPAMAPRESASTIRSTSAEVRVRTFESEIDPFEFSQLESGHFVLYRKVWREGQRYIQGLLIERRNFLDGVAQDAFRATALSRMSDLIVAYQGEVFAVYRGANHPGYLARTSELRGQLLYQARLDAPVGDLELILSINRLPAGPGATLIAWITVILAVVLCGGFLLLYRLGRGQITLARQQQDFVSAVSHELKTPLTSIRMYGEMLRAGWAPEAKKREYYDYIYDESERLSRLINNVLQLARMTRNDLPVTLQPVAIGALMDTIRSKIAAQVERAGFTLNLECPAATEHLTLAVDQDYFTQIIINLVDNAIKFSAKARKRAIDITCLKQPDGTMSFKVRDYGPGIPEDQMRKIFRLFYRSQSELTRETVGTGIGLALVNQLAFAMNGKVDVQNVEPGAEFRVIFALTESR